MQKMMDRMKIRKKLMTGFIVIAVIASMSGIISGVLMKVVDLRYSDALFNYGFSQGDIGKLLAAVAETDGAVHDVVGFTDEALVLQSEENYMIYKEEMEPLFEAVSETVKGKEEKAYYETARKAWDKYVSKAEELMKKGETTDAAAVKEVQGAMVSELDPIYDELYDAMSGLMAANVNTGNDLSVSLTALVWIILIVVAVIIVVVMLISIYIGTKIAKNVANPIMACAERLQLLAGGDLTSDVPKVTTEDEAKTLADATENIVLCLSRVIQDEEYVLGAMAEGNFDVSTHAEDYYKGDLAPILASLRNINKSLSDTLREIGESSQQVALASDQMAQGASTLAEGSTDQASAVEELLATVTEVTEQVEHNAGNAADASQEANTVGTQAEMSTKQMAEMTGAMNRINEASKQIAAIINTIEAIATQTNLLSLNAAIEAARAGEAGKGFAVVADEIRELATQSSEAANNTRDLISATIREVERGNEIAGSTAESLNQVAEGIGNIMGLINNVTEASTQQAASMQQINAGISQISQVVQSNSATAEENSATSEELSAQAENLNSLVSRFQLKRG